METVTEYEYEVQGRYTPETGWEMVTTEETRKEALARLEEYRAFESGVPFRIRRVKVEEA